MAATLVVAMVAQGTPAAADTVDPALYRERLAEARAALVAALDADAGSRAALVERAGALLRRTTALRLEGGTTIAIDDSALADRISTSEQALHSAVTDVGALVAALERGPAIDATAATAELRRLVGEQRARDAQLTLMEALARQLARFLASLGGAPPDARGAVVVGGGLGLALLLVLLGLMGRDLRERFRREVVLPELRAGAGPDPAARLREADEALRAGRMREAVHALYLYAIATLAAREAIRYDPSLTDRELLARAGTIPHADALRDLVEMHDRVWYGLREARADDAARARQLAARAAA